MKKKGLLITFEGGEGVGKTTQALKLKEHLEKEGKDVIVLREPGSTPISEQIRNVVLSNENSAIAYTTEVLLFQAARAQIYHEVVLPALKEGKVVIMDRSRDSSLVYQGMVRGFGAGIIEYLNDLSTDSTMPDITFLLDTPVEVSLNRRLLADDLDRIDHESKDFHEKVRKAYLKVANADLKKHKVDSRWKLIDADTDIPNVAEPIWELTKVFLERRKIKAK